MDPSSGGPCQGIRNLIPELQKLGVHNEVVSLDSPAAAFLGNDDFPIRAVGPATNPWSYSSKLVTWLDENFNRFDVVIVHGLWLYHGYAVHKALLRLKKHGTEKLPKVFVMPHGMLDPYFQKASGRKLKAIRNWVYWNLIEGKVLNNADGVLFTCDEELRLARQTFRAYHPKREINIGYGIADPPDFHSNMGEAFLNECPELKNQSYLLFLSRIHEKKGVDQLIKAYAQMVEESFSSGRKLPKLVIAGPGLETAYGQKLRQIAGTIRLKNQIFFPGMLSGKAKWGAFYL